MPLLREGIDGVRCLLRYPIPFCLENPKNREIGKKKKKRKTLKEEEKEKSKTFEIKKWRERACIRGRRGKQRRTKTEEERTLSLERRKIFCCMLLSLERRKRWRQTEPVQFLANLVFKIMCKKSGFDLKNS
jgi:hypothetical protein